MARSRGQKSKPFSPFRKWGFGIKSRAPVFCSGKHLPLVATQRVAAAPEPETLLCDRDCSEH